MLYTIYAIILHDRQLCSYVGIYMYNSENYGDCNFIQIDQECVAAWVATNKLRIINILIAKRDQLCLHEMGQELLLAKWILHALPLKKGEVESRN